MLLAHAVGGASSWRMLSLGALSLLALTFGAEQPPAITYLVTPPGSMEAFAADSRGNVYVAGRPFFITSVATPGAAFPSPTSDTDFYLAKYDSQGALVFATYIPGRVSGLTADQGGTVFLVAVQGSSQNRSLLVTVDPSGANATMDQLCSLCGYFPTEIALDSARNIYMAGNIGADPPATPGAFQANRAGGLDLFIVKYSIGERRVVYATYIGGSGSELLTSLAVDSAGNSFVGGSTRSKNFPVTSGSYRTTPPPGEFAGYLTKINPQGTALVYSTYFEDSVYRIALDRAGGVFAAFSGGLLAGMSPEGRQVLSSTKLDLAFAGFDSAGNIVAADGTRLTSYLGESPLQLLGLQPFLSVARPASIPLPPGSYRVLGPSSGNSIRRVKRSGPQC